MAARIWENPVRTALPGGGLQDVRGPFEALALLTGGWPFLAGPHFIRAKISCKAALDGRVPIEQAKRDFELAVREMSNSLRTGAVHAKSHMGPPGLGRR